MTTVSDKKLDFTPFSNIIDGKASTTKSTRSGVKPATNESLFPCPVSTPNDVDNAIMAASSSFKTWNRTSVEHRKNQLRVFSIALRSYRSEFARLLTTEQGKPVWMLSLHKVPNTTPDVIGEYVNYLMGVKSRFRLPFKRSYEPPEK